MRPRLRSLLCIAAAVILVACGQGIDEAELEQVRADLAQREATEAAILERLDELQTELAGISTATAAAAAENERATEERFEQLATELAELIEPLTVLEEGLAAETDARAEIASDLANATSDLRGSVDTLRRTTEELAGEVDELRTLYLTLRDRLDRSQR